MLTILRDGCDCSRVKRGLAGRFEEESKPKMAGQTRRYEEQKGVAKGWIAVRLSWRTASEGGPSKPQRDPRETQDAGLKARRYNAKRNVELIE